MYTIKDFQIFAATKICQFIVIYTVSVSQDAAPTYFTGRVAPELRWSTVIIVHSNLFPCPLIIECSKQPTVPEYL